MPISPKAARHDEARPDQGTPHSHQCLCRDLSPLAERPTPSSGRSKGEKPPSYTASISTTRTGERRVGKGCVSPSRSWRSPYHYKKKPTTTRGQVSDSP